MVKGKYNNGEISILHCMALTWLKVGVKLLKFKLSIRMCFFWLQYLLPRAVFIHDDEAFDVSGWTVVQLILPVCFDIWICICRQPWLTVYVKLSTLFLCFLGCYGNSNMPEICCILHFFYTTVIWDLLLSGYQYLCTSANLHRGPPVFSPSWTQ